ncbi:hypothetical protein D0B32_18175 [Paraburkholderia sp. DHOC27]|nr:hypothetical protein D0B32_18175 [Paraburkholderia sp. DHOC27]
MQSTAPLTMMREIRRHIPGAAAQSHQGEFQDLTAPLVRMAGFVLPRGSVECIRPYPNRRALLGLTASFVNVSFNSRSKA